MFVYQLTVDADVIVELELVNEIIGLNSPVSLTIVSMVQPKYELVPNAQSELEYADEDQHEFTVYLGFGEELDLAKIDADGCWVSRS